jgi:outer membrane protein OmpA-like peptidoglycan-associated protein
MSVNGSQKRSLLHLQMGQEVLYLLMCAGLFCSVVLLMLLSAIGQPMVKESGEPPIFILDETNGFFFQSGSAEVSADFRMKLNELVVPRLVQIKDSGRASVIEVVGHTDEQSIGIRKTNLDSSLLSYLNGDLGTNLSVADNVGLGMARAAAVSRILAGSEQLNGVTILPLSAGQTVQSSGRLAERSGAPLPEKERRRIEIRIRGDVTQSVIQMNGETSPAPP